MSTTAPAPAYPIEVAMNGGTLRLTWDNQKMPKDYGLLGCLFLFWLVWAPLTLFATFLLIVAGLGLDPTFFFSAVWCVFG